ncbi:hypothetical protein [Nocardioides nanhaiensis]|uniref:Transmembrane protein n=1 Tax=Nocardioides nanhaiensis TaxID=1476871 RepID=A0ABP8VZR7_9ACTN
MTVTALRAPLAVPLLLARALGLVVALALATVGSWGLGFGVMTACTSTTAACGVTQAVLVGGWIAQGALLVAAVALCLPRSARALPPARLLTATLLVPVLAGVLFAGTAWVAPRSYCLDRSVDYCGVAL